MTKTFIGIWHQTKVLCPKCLVQPGDINNYGSDHKGFWFRALCPHCSNVIKWYRKIDLSPPEVSVAAGEQMSLFDERKRISLNEQKAKKRNRKKYF